MFEDRKVGEVVSLELTRQKGRFEKRRVKGRGGRATVCVWTPSML